MNKTTLVFIIGVLLLLLLSGMFVGGTYYGMSIVEDKTGLVDSLKAETDNATNTIARITLQYSHEYDSLVALAAKTGKTQYITRYIHRDETASNDSALYSVIEGLYKEIDSVIAHYGKDADVIALDTLENTNYTAFLSYHLRKKSFFPGTEIVLRNQHQNSTEIGDVSFWSKFGHGLSVTTGIDVLTGKPSVCAGYSLLFKF